MDRVSMEALGGDLTSLLLHQSICEHLSEVYIGHQAGIRLLNSRFGEYILAGAKKEPCLFLQMVLVHSFHVRVFFKVEIAELVCPPAGDRET